MLRTRNGAGYHHDAEPRAQWRYQICARTSAPSRAFTARAPSALRSRAGGRTRIARIVVRRGRAPSCQGHDGPIRLVSRSPASSQERATPTSSEATRAYPITDVHDGSPASSSSRGWLQLVGDRRSCWLSVVRREFRCDGRHQPAVLEPAQQVRSHLGLGAVSAEL